MRKETKEFLIIISMVILFFIGMTKCTSHLTEETDRLIYERRCLEYRTAVVVGYEPSYNKQRTFIIMYKDSTFDTYRALKNSYSIGDSCEVCTRYNNPE